MAQLVSGKARKAKCTRSNAEGLDRFSGLPEHIVHHIFSSLSFDDTAKVGVLSKRCLHLFLSNPHLKIISKRSDFDSQMDSCKRFIDRVDRLLSQRNGSEICCLKLHSTCGPDIEASRIDKWINVAVSSHVRMIDLMVRLKTKFFELPQCIFCSKTLRTLKLNLCDEYYLKEPAGVFVSLEELSLCSISGFESFDCEHAVKKLISTACPSLKRLTIKAIDLISNLSIISPSLEELTLRDITDDEMEIVISTERLQKLSLHLTHMFNQDVCKIKINAPNLQLLDWKGSAANNIYSSPFEFLKIATLIVRITNGFVKKVTYLLQRVCFARRIELNFDVLELLPNCPFVEFGNLHHLVITVNQRLKDRQFPVFASFLMRAPNLEHLSLKCDAGYCSPGYDRLSVRKLEASELGTQHETIYNQTSSQLKVIEIELRGRGHQVGVIKHMLEFEKGLKQMTIFHSKEYSQALSKIGLHTSRTMSPPFQLNLVEKVWKS